MPSKYFWRKDLSKYTLKSFDSANEFVCDTNNSDQITYDANGTSLILADTSSAQVISGKGFTGFGPTVTASAATLAVTAALHAGKLVLVTPLAGITVTLPPATGTGNVYRFMRSVAATSVGDVYLTSDAVGDTDTNVMRGYMMQVPSDDSAAMSTWGTASTGTFSTETDTMAWNFSTTGICAIGDWVQFVDVAAGIMQVSGVSTISGTEANPFSVAS